MIRETKVNDSSGFPMLFVGILLVLGGVFLLLQARDLGAVAIVGVVISFLLAFLTFGGLFMVNPNEFKVMQLFGSYAGTAKDPGLRWANPFYAGTKVSVRVRNFETGKLKVNDSTGNPIEIAAVVVWKVVETAEALFNVDDFEDFVHVQSEAALRNLATGYPYTSHDTDGKSLSGNTAEISEKLRDEVQDRLDKAGIEVLEARMSHLAYSPEIAAAMLQRQQASAVVAARAEIVEGAVGMVDHALDRLKEMNVIELDEERKAAMVSNLLVVLCSDRHTQPVVNTGSLYQ